VLVVLLVVPVVEVVGVPVVEVVGVPVVEVVGVPVVEVVGVLLVVLLLVVLRGHLPLKSQGWFFRWRRRLCLLTKSVRALVSSHRRVSRSKGTWQTGTKHSSSSRLSWSSWWWFLLRLLRPSSSSSSWFLLRLLRPSASARDGISEAMAVPAKSFSARRRLSDPSATARTSSSKERLVVSLLTWGPFPPKGGTRGLAPPS
jgi:hypothetical protein